MLGIPLKDKNGNIIKPGKIRFPSGFIFQIEEGDDHNLYVFVGSLFFPLKMWDVTKLEMLND